MLTLTSFCNKCEFPSFLHCLLKISFWVFHHFSCSWMAWHEKMGNFRDKMAIFTDMSQLYGSSGVRTNCWWMVHLGFSCVSHQVVKLRADIPWRPSHKCLYLIHPPSTKFLKGANIWSCNIASKWRSKLEAGVRLGISGADTTEHNGRRGIGGLFDHGM